MANQLNVYREGVIISTFDIDQGTIFREKLHEARTITCPVATENALPLQDGDYIIHDSEVYIINTLPDFLKDGGELQKEYNITFEAEFYLLLDTFILNDQGHADFPLYGSAIDHLNVIFANANRNDTGWTVGEVAATEGQFLNYNWTYVRTALDEIAAAFKLEWSFTGRTIRMVAQVGTDTGLTFEVGRAKGLHQISRTQDSGKSVVTRVFGIGGSRNIDATYRSGLEPNLIFTGRYVETPGVTAGTERVREGKYENDQIYPRFNGNITGVVVNRDGSNVITDVVITDTAIDFDINAQLQEGVTAKVSFRTGALTGSEFEIASYNATTKAIELIPTADTNGYVLPNDLNLPLVGDKFTLLDIRMPAAYVTAAELELRNAALQYLDDNDKSRLLFGVKPDPKFLRENNIVLKVGDRATAIEAEVGLNEILRFTEISYPLVNTFDVTGVIGNEIAYNKVVKLFAEVLQNSKDVQTIDRRSAELAKRGVKDLRAFEASVFDTDGMFDSDKFNVGVLTAILGIFGAKSQNFKLNGVYITDNYGANPAQVAISGGELIHFEIENAGAGGNIWTITPLLADVPTTSALYYVYARCSTSAQVGSWVVTTDQIKPDVEAGYYHFLTGVVYPVIDGWRNSDFTNGIADINGNRLKIGKIISRDGLTGFDLDASTIFGAITFASGSSGYANIADKPDLSIYATEQFVDAIKDELQDQIDGAITTWFYPYAPTLNNAPANGWVTDEEKNKQLGDLFYDDTTGYAYRFQVVGGVYSWTQISDTDITLALQKAQEAQDTADGKRRVFTATPVTPYDEGDLWSQGTGGDLMRCNVARSAGAYVAADWGLASKYTDDTAVDNLVIGGRNMMLGSNFNGGLSGWDYNGGAVTAETIDGKTCIKIISTANGNGVYTFSKLAVPVESGEQYSVSFDIKGIYYDVLTIVVGFNSVMPNTVIVPNSPVWTRVNYTRTALSGGSDAIVIYGGGGSQQFYITNIKIEKGNKATDWTPAPEDVKAEADAAAAAAQAAAINYADAKAYSAGKILYRDIEFREGVNGILTYNNSSNGNVIIERLTRNSWGEGTAHSLPTTSTHGLRIRNLGPASPGLGGFFFGTQSRANAKFVTRIIANIPVGYSIHWATNAYGDGGINTWATSQAGTGVWTEYINVTKCGSSGAFALTNYFYLEGGDGMEWYIASATVYDVTDSEVDYIKDATTKANAAQAAAISQAAATAETIAQSKANIAEAAAIAAAASDATSKANAAKAAAEAASNTFAQTAANDAKTAAEVAAAADASNKANQAYSDAVTVAANAQANLTATLKNLAYTEIDQLEGITTINKNGVTTVKLDALYVKANIVNADYVNTLSLNAAVITSGLISADRIDVANFYAEKLAAVEGTIGDWEISGSSIVSGSYGGRLTSDVAYVDGGKTMVNIGPTLIEHAPSPGSTYEAARFLSTSIRSQNGNVNKAIYAEASGAALTNYAIHAVSPVANGSALYADGHITQIGAGSIAALQSLLVSSGSVKLNNIPTWTSLGGSESTDHIRILTSGPNAGRLVRHNS